MSEEILSLERFASLLEAYGGRLERWPEHDARAARALLDVSERAKAMLREEAKFDERLDELELAPLSGELARRLAEIPARAERSSVIWPFGWGPVFGWAAAAAIGLWIGISASEDVDEQDTASARDDVELVSLATGTFSELEDE